MISNCLVAFSFLFMSYFIWFVFFLLFDSMWGAFFPWFKCNVHRWWPLIVSKLANILRPVYIPQYQLWSQFLCGFNYKEPRLWLGFFSFHENYKLIVVLFSCLHTTSHCRRQRIFSFIGLWNFNFCWARIFVFFTSIVCTVLFTFWHIYLFFLTVWLNYLIFTALVNQMEFINQICLKLNAIQIPNKMIHFDFNLFQSWGFANLFKFYANDIEKTICECGQSFELFYFQ